MKIKATAIFLALLLCACAAPADTTGQTSPSSVSPDASSVSDTKEPAVSSTADSREEAQSTSSQQAPLLKQPEVSSESNVSGSNSKKDSSLKVDLSITAPVLGETMTIRVSNAKEASVQTNLGFTPRFFQDNGDLLALLPISYAAQPGNYTLDVLADGKNHHYTLAVAAREFEVQELTVDPDTTAATAGSAKANAEWETRVEPLKALSDSDKHWNGTFMQPVQGTITTEFGSIRYTNGGAVASRHSGIDIAAKTDTPVLAAGNGRVLFADFLQLTGNTVVIEHGYGLKSLYYHMNSLSVEEGDMVEQGTQIGAVGTTGFSTGPHLHFAMAVNNVFTNPWTMMEQGIG